MKKSKRLLAFLMGATILATSFFGGCGGAGYAAGATEGAPDYSQSQGEFRTWSFGQVMDDWVMLNQERYYEIPGLKPAGSFQTKERTQDLKDAGFNTVFVDWSFSGISYSDIETIKGSSFERVVKDCEEIGLDTLWYGHEFHGWSGRTESNINPEKYAAREDVAREKYTLELTHKYKGDSEALLAEIKAADPTLSDEEANALLEQKIDEKVAIEVEENIEVYTLQKGEGDMYFKDQDHMNRMFKFILDPIYENYPSCIGFTLIDEPNWKMFPQIREVLIGLYNYDPDMYIMLNLLPMTTSGSIHNSYCEGGSSMGMVPAYKEYLRQYKEYFGDLVDFIMYDDYPVLYSGLLTSFMQCHEIVSDFAKENGFERRIVLQTYDDGNHRTPKTPDMLFQANVAMAFGCNDFSNYTYLPFTNSNGASFPNQEEHVMRWDGTKTDLWYGVQQMNQEILYNGKILSNFKFVESTYLRTEMTAPSGWNYTMGMTQGNMQKLSDVSFVMLKDMGGMILVTEMYDEANDQWGYYVVNATDPGVSSEVEVTLTFNDYKNVQIVQSMNTTNLALKDNQIVLQIGSGRGAFVMPY